MLMTTTRRITTSAALALSVAAAAAPGASARPNYAPAASVAKAAPAVYSRQDKSMVAPEKSPSGQAILAKVSLAHPRVRVETPNTGFDWGDAGIGAASAITVTML